MEATKEKRDVYEIVTARIIEQLEKGVIPWKKSWTDAGIPQNLISKRPYRGINLWLLASLGYSSNFFLTFNQAKEIGATIKKDEKPHPVIYWKRVEETENSEIPKKPILRYYSVFNITQCEGMIEHLIPAPVERINDPIAICESIVEHMPCPPRIRHLDPMPYYHPILDIVNMPNAKKFKDSESYYATLFHELVHSTGHQSRLNRKNLAVSTYGAWEYSFEEMVAELGAAYLNYSSGMSELQIADSASYINGWLKALKGDKRMIVFAGGHAQKAADYILNITHDEKGEIVSEVEISTS